MSDFPRTVQEISNAWLTQTLRDRGALASGEVTGITSENIGSGQRLNSAVYRLEISYSSPLLMSPETLIAKFSSEGKEPRAKAQRLGLYDREVNFYLQSPTKSLIRVPNHYFAEVDSEGDDSLLLLEDLARFREVDQGASCSIEDARSALSSIAKLHAKWWDDEYLEGYKWLIDLDAPGFLAELQARYEQSLDIAFGVLGGCLPNGFEEVARKYASDMIEMAVHNAGRPRTLTHGDYRTGNMFFNDSPGHSSPVVAFDWQLAGRSPAASDVSNFICWSLGTDDRRASERELISYYYDQLVDLGISNYSRAEYEDDVRRTLFDVVANTILSAEDIKGTMKSEAGQKRVSAMCERLQTVIDWNIDELIIKS